MPDPRRTTHESAEPTRLDGAVRRGARCAAAALLVTVALAGCETGAPTTQREDPAPASPGTVGGELVIGSGAALEAGEVAHVKLIERDEGVPVASEAVRGPAASPIPFTVRYDPARIDTRLTYVIEARVVGDGGLKYVASEDAEVLTRGNPSRVSLELTPVN